MITRNFNLFLNAGNSIPLVINVNQFDSGEQWIFTLFNGDGTQYIPSTGAIVGIKSDGLGIINSGSVNESGQVVISETQQMTAAVGKAVFELMIDNQTHGTANFVVLVEEKPGNNADLSESDLSLLEEAISATSPLPTGGTVGQVLTKTANGSTWSDAGTPTQEQVADAVSDWADEHITVTTGVVIDTSLSVAGAAADAKKTGDEVADLKSAFANVWNAVIDGKCDNTATTDNTTKIQTAIDNASDGTIFYFPKGRYLCNSLTFDEKKNIKIVGDGYGWIGGTILQFTGAYSFIVLNGGTHISIENLLIYKYEEVTTSRAIFFRDTKPTTMDCRMIYTSVKDVAIQGFRYGIEFAVPSGYNYFDNVRVSEIANNGRGIIIGGQYANTATNARGDAIRPNYIYLNKCSIDGIKYGTGIGLTIATGQEIFVQDCDICNFEDGTGVQVYNNNAVSNVAQYLFFSSNAFFKNKIGLTVNSYTADASIKGISVIGNLFLGANVSEGVGINLIKSSASAKNIENVTIVGNTMNTFAETWTPLVDIGVDANSYYKVGVGL